MIYYNIKILMFIHVCLHMCAMICLDSCLIFEYYNPPPPPPPPRPKKEILALPQVGYILCHRMLFFYHSIFFPIKNLEEFRKFSFVSKLLYFAIPFIIKILNMVET